MDYDLSSGPQYDDVGSRRSVRGSRRPHDLTRSHRIGISEQHCAECAVLRYNAGDNLTHHDAPCSAPGEWFTVIRKPASMSELLALIEDGHDFALDD